MDVDQELLAIFHAEVGEQLDDLCVRLAQDPATWRVERLFQISHNVKGAARMVGAETLSAAAHAVEDLFHAIRDGLPVTPDLAALGRRGGDLLEACFRDQDEAGGGDAAAFRAEVDLALGVAAAAPADAPMDQPKGTDAAASARDEVDTPGGSAETIRVGADKLDSLTGLAADVVAQVFASEVHTKLAKDLLQRLVVAGRRNRALAANAEYRACLTAARGLHQRLQEHLTTSLRAADDVRESVRSLGLVRIDGLRSVLGRSLRDACRLTGKRAELRIDGASTEIDRAMFERLRDPLVHLVRNAVAHGIEDPAVRAQGGKPELGSVVLTARTVGARVEIVVADDGDGVDLVRLRAKAVADGLVDQRDVAALGDDAVIDLVFRSGMSTATRVTELAGRGVGLDVVRSAVVELGGDVIVTSEAGRGSRFALVLPLTRLTTAAIVVRVGERLYAFPVGDVARAVKVGRADLATVDGHSMLASGDTLVRAVRLDRSFTGSRVEADWGAAVVVSDGPRERAILVDEVLGQRELLVRPVPWNMVGVPGLAGCAVVDGGDVVLLLDPRELRPAGDASVWTRAGDVRPVRVLVVDDSVTSRTLIANILKAAAYDVTVAVDGEEALARLGEETFDLVVTDVEMPRMNGFELTRAIRLGSGTEHLPVILVTSLGRDEDRTAGAEAGADAYIVKGAFDQDELLRSVARLV